jgi:putative tricarboxylic transport membrane protein
MTKDLACGLIAMVVAAVYLVATAGLQTSLLGDTVGTAGFPTLIGWGMALVGLILVVQSLWRRYRGETAEGPSGWIPSEAFAAGAARATARAAGVVAIIVAYLVLFHPLGYIPSVGIMVAATALFLGAPPTWRVAAVSAIGAVALWLLFGVLLQIPLPAGVLSGWL